MSLSYAILIDAGFLKVKLGKSKQPADANCIREFVDRLVNHDELSSMRLHRVYFYDASPLEDEVEKPLSGGRINFASTESASRNKSIHSDLSTAPYFALRFGELVHRGWQVRKKVLKQEEKSVEITCDELAPNIQQKGVDMRIGLDIASLTLKKHVEVIVLVTGDSDFVPAMKFARREGAQLFLVTLGHGVRESLLEHADKLIEIS